MSAPEGLPTRAAKDVRKYLLDDEDAVVVTRRHWAVLIVPTLKFLPVLLAGGWLLVLDPENGVTSTVGMLVVLAAVLTYALRVGEWWFRHFIVSRRRVLLTSGVIVRTVTLLPLRRITDLTWKETFFGQILGYGTFRFESAGQQQGLSEITFLPRAGDLYREVSGLLFGSDWGSASSGDDEGNPEAPPPAGPVATGGRRDTEPLPQIRPREP
ncbi:PH domain-containing protein [Blastococcus sp. MG754426]|uniref:PH domain-containing protein n=1 Tax=unclassified Blastococcus TaxID=2619396 RepID=UPI001EF15312|nr:MULTISPECIES: PH domain-containing protein [unclassified Blastococcus]MCF6507152.1 PH domain-containing protein [Blastococcus sp. MG754426]MCF6512658.1 PH domain-containing protein [Blastococcus sp. MG754427]